MADWYTKQTWTKTDEEEFFFKLQRARKSGRAQYLKIQAIVLVDTNNDSLLDVAESLLNRMLDEYPGDDFNKSSALDTLGKIYEKRNNLPKAMEYYKQAIDFETVYPKVKTQAYLHYSELIIKTGSFDLYNTVEAIIMEQLPGLTFPNEKYKAYSILSIINAYKDNPGQALYYSNLAEENATAETSGLRYHKNLGLVSDRDSVLDSLITKNKNNA